MKGAAEDATRKERLGMSLLQGYAPLGNREGKKRRRILLLLLVFSFVKTAGNWL